MGNPKEAIRKIGYLKKLKTMKKKFFVLRETGPEGPACLDYYDNERKYKANTEPKRSIILQTCLGISNKSDSKQKHAIVIYTKDDCFSMACDNEEEQKSWLDAMLELRNEQMPADESVPPLFEHVWPVTLKNKGLASCGKVISPGPFRLCLTNMSLSLIRPSRTDPDILLQFESIRRCGRGDCFFFLEVGRCASSGAGELWMQVEDGVIAQSIHEAVHSSMEASRKEAPRNRSHSTVSEKSKPQRSHHGHHNSSTLPKRSQSISIGGNDSPTWIRRSPVRSMSRASAGMGLSHSPMSSSPIPQSALSESHRSRTDSMGSATYSSSFDEGELSPQGHQSSRAGSTSSLTQETAHHEDSDYLPMAGPNIIGVTMSPIDNDMVDDGHGAATDGGYMPMTPGIVYARSDTGDDPDSYMNMTPSPAVSLSGASSYFDMSNNGSYSASPASTTGSLDNQDHSLYFDMKTTQPLAPVDERFDSPGYMDMMPGQTSPAILLKPDKVTSYLSDSSSVDDFPKRTYSVGSKPTHHTRIEDGYVDMSGAGGGGQLSTSTPNMAENPAEVVHGQSAAVGASASQGQDERLMEFDFYRGMRPADAFRARTSSGSKDLRPRTSSYSHSDMRQRASSFSTGSKNVSRHGSMGKFEVVNRPRTATICQDSLRPRTSSVGTTDSMRPRSSSYGNTRNKKPFNRSASQTTSQENLRKLLLKTSQESLMQGNKDYFIMAPQQGAIADLDSVSRSPQPDGYHLGTASEGADYLDMTVPAVSANPPHRPDSILASGSYMSMDMSVIRTDHKRAENVTKLGGGLSPQPVPSFRAFGNISKKGDISSSRPQPPTTKEPVGSDYMSMSPVASPLSGNVKDSSADNYMMMGSSPPVSKPSSILQHPSHTRTPTTSNTGSLKRQKVTSPLAHEPPKPHLTAAPATVPANKDRDGEYISLEYNVKVQLLPSSSSASGTTRTSRSPVRHSTSPSAPTDHKTAAPSAETKKAADNTDSYFCFAPGKPSDQEKDDSLAALSSQLQQLTSPVRCEEDDKPVRSKTPEAQLKQSSTSYGANKEEYINVVFDTKKKKVPTATLR